MQQHDKDYIHLQSEATAKLKDLSKERDVLDALGTQLRANQAALKSSLVAAQEAAAKQDAEITDLKEQVGLRLSHMARYFLGQWCASCAAIFSW